MLNRLYHISQKTKPQKRTNTVQHALRFLMFSSMTQIACVGSKKVQSDVCNCLNQESFLKLEQELNQSVQKAQYEYNQLVSIQSAL